MARTATTAAMTIPARAPEFWRKVVLLAGDDCEDCEAGKVAGTVFDGFGEVGGLLSAVKGAVAGGSGMEGGLTVRVDSALKALDALKHITTIKFPSLVSSYLSSTIPSQTPHKPYPSGLSFLRSGEGSGAQYWHADAYNHGSLSLLVDLTEHESPTRFADVQHGEVRRDTRGWVLAGRDGKAAELEEREYVKKTFQRLLDFDDPEYSIFADRINPGTSYIFTGTAHHQGQGCPTPAHLPKFSLFLQLSADPTHRISSEQQMTPLEAAVLIHGFLSIQAAQQYIRARAWYRTLLDAQISAGFEFFCERLLEVLGLDFRNWGVHPDAESALEGVAGLRVGTVLEEEEGGEVRCREEKGSRVCFGDVFGYQSEQVLFVKDEED
ncbi:hypothetical protein HDV05_000593 [Chytridiales sp. JEL 0842]|nr:hypothetical protein HDV05_000593 [Chytridiales sp. JEL 0842]